jgi:N-terminal domain of reverse transcriptase
MSMASEPMYQWNTIRWSKIERKVFKLQKRIYRAAQRGDHRQVRRLQQLLLHSHYAKQLAVRQVTQDNRGKKTPGVDGITALTPAERRSLAEHLQLDGHAAPVRRVYIPKPGTLEQRPLGIPTIRGTGCGRTARPGLCGGRRVIGVPTAETPKKFSEVTPIAATVKLASNSARRYDCGHDPILPRSSNRPAVSTPPLTTIPAKPARYRVAQTSGAECGGTTRRPPRASGLSS